MVGTFDAEKVRYGPMMTNLIFTKENSVHNRRYRTFMEIPEKAHNICTALQPCFAEANRYLRMKLDGSRN